MVEIFLCYAECDRGVAEAIAGRLDLAAEATVTFQPCGSGEDQTVATRWEMGEFSQGIVLVLSPECVPPLSRDAWEPLIQHSIGGTAPPVASVLVRDCQFPQVLRRRNHFRCASGDALPALHRWAIRLQPPAGEDWEPVDPLPWFQGREREMDVLWKTIVERAGVAVITGREGSGKSCLAQHLAYHAAEFFRGVAWNPGLQPEEGRFLRVLDDASAAPGPAVAGESLLVTARELDLPGAARIHLETMPGPPIESPARADELGLWRAMALCSPKGFSLEFAAHIARMGTTALDLSGSLVDKRLADPLSGRGRRLRLGPASRKAALESTDVSALRDRHARAVAEALKGWRTEPAARLEFLPEAGAALDWAIRSAWDVAWPLADRAAGLLAWTDHVTEATELLIRLRDAAEERWDDHVAAGCRDELRRYRTGFGRPLREDIEQPSLFDV